MDPLSFSGSLSGGLKGGAGGSAGPSSVFQEGGMFDSSGWNVNFSGGRIESSRGLDLGPYGPYIALALVGIVLWKLLKKS